jgi:hypothetical protein
MSVVSSYCQIMFKRDSDKPSLVQVTGQKVREGLGDLVDALGDKAASTGVLEKPRFAPFQFHPT